MSRIFVIGATGGVASRLIPLLIRAGHRVTGLHRRPEQARLLQGMGAEPCLGDMIDLSEDRLAELSWGHDMIVFSAGAAGSGAERTTAIDGDGPGKALQAAWKNGIRRFYLVSAFMDANRGSASEGFEHYIRQKRRGDCAVASSFADWIILRPGKLLDEAGTGRVTAGRAVPYGMTSRGNVALMLATLIDTPLVTREIIEMTDGDTPVDNAVAALMRPC